MNKLAKKEDIQQRRTYVKEVKKGRLAIRNFRHPNKRAMGFIFPLLYFIEKITLIGVRFTATAKTLM